MMKLLIVDDEPYTVDGLFEMISEITDLEIELFCAYSADEAIQRLTRTKMDIVLSDIRMPGMNGLELQQWIHTRWSSCKVIFLTGISDVQYIQQAIRAGGVDYILKTEGDEAIVRSIRQAIHGLEENSQSDQFILRAKDQLAQAIPIMSKEWFMNLLDARRKLGSLQDIRFQELGILLNREEQVLLVGGKVDRWKEDFSSSNQALMLYAIQNIAEEYLKRVSFLPIILDNSEFIWLIQPEQSWDELSWKDSISYVLGTLESIQTTCKNLLQVPVSLVCTENSTSWDNVSNMYSQLKQTMVLGFGNGEEMLITNCEDEPISTVFQLTQGTLSDLERALEAGQEIEFSLILDALFENLPLRFGVYAQTYYSVAILLVEKMNKFEQNGEPFAINVIERLMNLAVHETKSHALLFLKTTVSELFLRKKRVRDDRTHRIIYILNQHIRDHLADDLSLDALADRVYLNSSYLSNLYKQVTGANISEYIADQRVVKAKELLANSPLKIHEIAVNCGFGTAGYFTRFFKKHVGVTPQDFRSSNEK